MKITMTKDRRMPTVNEARPYGALDRTLGLRAYGSNSIVDGTVLQALPTEDIEEAASDLYRQLPTEQVQAMVVDAAGQLVPLQQLSPDGSQPAPVAPSNLLMWALAGGALWLLWNKPLLLAAAVAAPMLLREKKSFVGPVGGCRSCKR